MYFIGVDLGGTKIATALMNEVGGVIDQDKRLTEAAKGPAHVFNSMKEAIYKVAADITLEQVAGIGLGIPGLVNLNKGLSLFAGNLGWQNIPVLDEFKKEFMLPIFMDNDVRAAALGEKYFGAGQGITDLMYITLGTGVGSGIIINGKLYRGVAYYAGEIGHTTVFKDGLLCNCGNRGCLELYVSAPGIVRRAREYIDSGFYTVMTKLVEDDLTKLTAEIVSKAADAGDRLARMIIDETAEILGISIANALNILNLSMVIIGGGVSLAGDKLFVPLRTTVRERTMYNIGKHVPIVPAQLDDRSGMIGAAALAMTGLGCI